MMVDIIGEKMFELTDFQSIEKNEINENGLK